MDNWRYRAQIRSGQEQGTGAAQQQWQQCVGKGYPNLQVMNEVTFRQLNMFQQCDGIVTRAGRWVMGTPVRGCEYEGVLESRAECHKNAQI